MRNLPFLFVLGLFGALAFVGCGDDDDGGDVGDGGSRAGSAGASGGKNSGGSQSSGGRGGTTSSAGMSNDAGAGPASGGAETGADGGAGNADQGGNSGGGFGGEGGEQFASGGEVGFGGEGGAALEGVYAITSDGYVSSSIKAAITKQLSPLDENEPVLVELGTLSYYPVELSNVAVTVPPGFQISSLEENYESRRCPEIGSGNRLRCRQYFVLELFPTTACKLDGDYGFSFDVGCAGGKCSLINPALETYGVTAHLQSEDLCSTYTFEFDPYRPTAKLLTTAVMTPPVLQAVTTIEHPYTLTADMVVPPPGFTLTEFSEDLDKRVCDSGDVPNGCQQFWKIAMNPGKECNLSGPYAVTWDVGCEEDGNCDPSVTSFVLNGSINDKRTLCQK